MISMVPGGCGPGALAITADGPLAGLAGPSPHLTLSLRLLSAGHEERRACSARRWPSLHRRRTHHPHPHPHPHWPLPLLPRLHMVGYDPAKPAIWLVEDVVEYMPPELVSAMFATMAAHSAPGSRLVASLSDVKLRDLLRRYGRTSQLVEEYEPPGIVLNRCLGPARAGVAHARTQVGGGGLQRMLRMCTPPSRTVCTGILSAQCQCPCQWCQRHILAARRFSGGGAAW